LLLTYGELKNSVLKLMSQYSVAGTKVAATYNNQADYLARMPELTNDALVYIATTARRLRATAALELRETMGKWNIYRMPDDFWQLCTGGIFCLDGDESIVRSNKFKILGARRLAIPAEPARDWMIEYFRYPSSLGTDPEDELALDCPEEACSAVAFYVASHLVMQDDPYAQATLYNEFETKLSRLGEMPAAERGAVENAYPGLEVMGWDW
jgi:hypothetical protein